MEGEDAVILQQDGELGEGEAGAVGEDAGEGALGLLDGGSGGLKDVCMLSFAIAMSWGRVKSRTCLPWPKWTAGRWLVG